jgi:hypothetical protein
LSGIAIARWPLRRNPGFDRDHTASRKTIETVNGRSKRGFCACSRASFSRECPPKVGIAVGNRDNLRGIPSQLLHCCNTCGANETESRFECGDRLYFGSCTLKMIV